MAEGAFGDNNDRVALGDDPFDIEKHKLPVLAEALEIASDIRLGQRFLCEIQAMQAVRNRSPDYIIGQEIQDLVDVAALGLAPPLVNALDEDHQLLLGTCCCGGALCGRARLRLFLHGLFRSALSLCRFLRHPIPPPRGGTVTTLGGNVETAAKALCLLTFPTG